MPRISHTRAVFVALGGACLLVASSALAAFGHASAAKVSYEAKMTVGGTFTGDTSDLEVREEGGKIHFVVGLKNLTAGMNLRTKHMREKYLEVEKFPSAELVVDRAALAIPDDGKSSSGKVNGTFTLHGKSQPVSVAYTAKRSGSAYDIGGSFTLNVNNHGIEVPSYLGVTVKPDVAVSLSARVTD